MKYGMGHSGQKVFSKTGGKKGGALGGATPFNLTPLSLALRLVCVHLKRLEIGAKLGSKELVKKPQIAWTRNEFCERMWVSSRAGCNSTSLSSLLRIRCIQNLIDMKLDAFKI